MPSRPPDVGRSVLMRTDEVMDLVPVRPLADDEAPIQQAYRDRLTALYGRIKP